jgi:hypothetical protein
MAKLTEFEKEMVKEVMERVSFDAIHTAIASLGWQWAIEVDPESRSITYAVPTKKQIKKAAKRLLKQVIIDNSMHVVKEYNGLCAEKLTTPEDPTDIIYLKLWYTLTEGSVTTEELLY